jgi:hypothetical protein
MDVFWFLVGIPVAVEVLAGILGCADLIRHHGLRGRALARPVAPALVLASALWLATPRHWRALAGALALVVAWQILIWLAARALVGSRRFAAESIDTED